MQRKYGLLTVVAGGLQELHYSNREIVLTLGWPLASRSCFTGTLILISMPVVKKNSYAMAHASKYSLSKNLVYPSMEGGQLNSAFLRLYLKTILLTNTQVLGCHWSARQHIISGFTCQKFCNLKKTNIHIFYTEETKFSRKRLSLSALSVWVSYIHIHIVTVQKENPKTFKGSLDIK